VCSPQNARLRAAVTHIGRPQAETAVAQLTSRGRSPPRAPDGKHTAWGFCHVPNAWQGSAEEEQVVVDRIEEQIERIAPRFRERILARAVNTPHRLDQWNTSTLALDGVYAFSASRPPGGGVHGMVGYHAARAALRERFGVR
jgi:phytoene dehydrogenase-like protein